MAASTSLSDPYLLSRTSFESHRLNKQQRLLLQCTGHFVHPSLGDLSQFRYILDNATGTTAWINDLLAGGVGAIKVNLRDDVVVDGADISDKQFPKEQNLNPRIGELYVQNVLEAFPTVKLGR